MSQRVTEPDPERLSLTHLCRDHAELFQVADLRELFADIHVVSLPMVARFRGIERREAMLVRGPAGWAEFSPFVEYALPQAARWFAAAVESAWFDFPTVLREKVSVNATLPAVPPGRVAQILHRYDGAQTVKIKVAEKGLASLDEDLARITEVIRIAPHMRIRLDANGGWTSVAEALAACERLARHTGLMDALEYLEQPVPTVEGLAQVRVKLRERHYPIRIAADESIRKVEDPLRVAQLQAADHIIVKVQPLGGIRQALRVVEQTGLSATVSSALDTSIGLAAGVALAAALPTPHPCAAGLGTGSLFAQDVCEPALVVRGGYVPVGRTTPHPELLALLKASPERTRWWEHRAQLCLEYVRDVMV